MDRVKKKQLLFLAFLLAIVVHILGVYSLHNSTMEYRSLRYKQWDYRNQSLSKRKKVSEDQALQRIFRTIKTKESERHSHSLQRETVSIQNFSAQELLPNDSVLAASEEAESLLTAQALKGIDTTSTIQKKPVLAKIDLPLASEKSNHLGLELLEASERLFNDHSIQIPYLNTSPSDIPMEKIAKFSKEKSETDITAEEVSKLLHKHFSPAPSTVQWDSTRNLSVAGETASIASSSDFHISVEFIPQSYGQGYLFRIKLLPKEDVVFRRIRQNVFFLIDRSNSIDRDRFALTKEAVAHALDMLHETDTFNILFFDSKIQRLASNNLPATSVNIRKAKNYLSRGQHGGLFASTDLYSSLDKIIPESVEDNEVNTAILLSDGDTYLSREKQRESIADWTKRNQGKVSLFCVAAGKNNNLALLELLSAFNRGTLAYAPRYEQLQDKLLKLMQAIQNPIGKDIVISAVTGSGKETVSLFPRSSRVPELYSNIPYIIFGTVDELQDFHLFIQGKYYNKWLDIHKKVSFKHAKRGNASIEQYWTLHRAYDYYDRYLDEGKRQYLSSVQKLLRPLRIPVAFQ
ncbi:MAG: hypothetical protein CMO81_10380 [Waddliaceae bacterium]|nr:hypothetical protein [Waddliaceae bacterium]